MRGKMETMEVVRSAVGCAIPSSKAVIATDMENRMPRRPIHRSSFGIVSTRRPAAGSHVGHDLEQSCVPGVRKMRSRFASGVWSIGIGKSELWGEKQGSIASLWEKEVPHKMGSISRRGWGEERTELKGPEGRGCVAPRATTAAPMELQEVYPRGSPRVGRVGRNMRDLIVRPTTQTDMEALAKSQIERWSRELVIGGKRLSSKIYKLREDGELLVEMISLEKDDPTAEAGPRKVVTKRQVVLTTDVTTNLVLHWGVARDEPGQWLLPPEEMRPPGSHAVSAASVETPFQETQGCFKDSTECLLLQRVVIDLPGHGPDEVMGLQFVIRCEDGSWWYKDESNGWANFTALFEDEKLPMGEVEEILHLIVRAETTGSWWTLMHRFNLCNKLLDRALKMKDPVSGTAALFIWLRFSAMRLLTWQRNYNVKPRELSAAQLELTDHVVKIWRKDHRQREMMRMILSVVGRGGSASDGQAIRDEILNIMHRNRIEESRGLFLEQWHQKLHNNTTPDDIIICDAYLAFLRSNGDKNSYWKTLEAGGITRQRMESYERPIVDEPTYRPDMRNSLINDFTNYRKILVRVHSGAELETAVDACRWRFTDRINGILNFVMQQRQSSDVLPLAEAIVECRQELRCWGMMDSQDKSHMKDLLYLDIALEREMRLAVERASFTDRDEHSIQQMAKQMELTSLAIENLCLSAHSGNEEFVLCLDDWKRIQSSLAIDAKWPLRAKAVADRLRHSLSMEADRYMCLLHPPATFIGNACGVDKWIVDLFAEEVIRSTAGFSVSLLLSRIDPILRSAANLGSWQIISPAFATGLVKSVDALQPVQNKVYDRPTILVADRVTGGEEIPRGVVAVLTGCTVDVLSHAAVRARNAAIFFATCYDQNILSDIKKLDGEVCNLVIESSGADVRITKAEAEAVGDGAMSTSYKTTAKVHPLRAQPFCGKFVVSMGEFSPDVVGAKSRNTRRMFEELRNGGIPEWVHIPQSVAIPFGSFEKVLDHEVNSTIKRELNEIIDSIDDSNEEALEGSLAACRSKVMELEAPAEVQQQVIRGIEENGIFKLDGDKWVNAWNGICGVWASKWTTRAYISVSKAGLRHEDIRMSVLVQPIIPADYGFVLHTENPSTGNRSEIYGEIVKGLGETLVGNFPGRALCFTYRKDRSDAPKVSWFPSKSIAQFINPTIIFRSDSNAEDLDGYAGAGLYDSIPMEEATVVFADYANDPLVWDEVFRRDVLTQISNVGIAIEASLGQPQDIEGVVKDREIHIVQTRPQV